MVFSRNFFFLYFYVRVLSVRFNFVYRYRVLVFRAAGIFFKYLSLIRFRLKRVFRVYRGN